MFRSSLLVCYSHTGNIYKTRSQFTNTFAYHIHAISLFVRFRCEVHISPFLCNLVRLLEGGGRQTDGEGEQMRPGAGVSNCLHLYLCICICICICIQLSSTITEVNTITWSTPILTGNSTITQVNLGFTS